MVSLLHPRSVGELLILLAAANITPILLNRIFGHRGAYPIDGYRCLADGRRLFGSSKTVRGGLSSILVTTVVALALDIPWNVGVAAGTGSMMGDLLSSFWKRRQGLPAGGRATGVDQIPESLLPTLFVSGAMSLSPLDVVITVAAFFIGEIVLSILFFKLHLRERPY